MTLNERNLEQAILDMYALFDLYMRHRPRGWDGGSFWGDIIESRADGIIHDLIPAEYDAMGPEWVEELRRRKIVSDLWEK